MSAEMTAAMERARHAMGITGFDQREAYLVLDAALDVEEMARPLCRRIHRSLWPIESNPSTRKPCVNCIEHMVIIRTALLGADS